MIFIESSAPAMAFWDGYSPNSIVLSKVIRRLIYTGQFRPQYSVFECAFTFVAKRRPSGNPCVLTTRCASLTTMPTLGACLSTNLTYKSSLPPPLVVGGTRRYIKRTSVSSAIKLPHAITTGKRCYSYIRLNLQREHVQSPTSSSG